MDKKGLIFTNDMNQLIDKAVQEYVQCPGDFYDAFPEAEGLDELMDRIGENVAEDEPLVDAVLVALDEYFDPENPEHLKAARECITKDYENDEYLQGNLLDEAMNSFVEQMRTMGLDTPQQYLCFGKNIEWKNLSGFKMEEVQGLTQDAVHFLPAASKWTINVYAERTPCLRAVVSTPDAQEVSYTIIPESWLAEAMKEPELEEMIRGAMRKSFDVRDMASRNLLEMQGENMSLVGIKYGILESIDDPSPSTGDSKITWLKTIAANLAVLDLKTFENDVAKKVARWGSSASDVLSIPTVRAKPYYKDYEDKAWGFCDYMPKKTANKELAEGIFKVLKTSDEKKLEKMLYGLFGKDRNKEISRLKKLGKEMSAGR